MNDLDIPDFLKLSAADRAAGWKGNRTRWTKDMKFTPPPSREEEAATKALRKQLAAEAKAKQEARFAALRALREARR